MPQSTKTPLNVTVLHYAVAETKSNDRFIIIEYDESRHPITDITIDSENSRVSWTNAQGSVEALGLDIPLSAEVMQKINEDEIFISEGDLNEGVLGKHVWLLSGLPQEESEPRHQEG